MSARPVLSLHEKMQALRQGYIDSLLSRLSEIQAVSSQLLSNHGDETTSELRRLAHSLAGSGATFGFPELSQSASKLESHLEDLLKQGNIDNNLNSKIQPLLADIEKQITTIQNLPDDHVRKATWATEEAIEISQDAKNKRILIVDDDQAIAERIANSIEDSGYTAQIISKLDELENAINKYKPATIIMDLVFPESGLGGSDAIQQVQKIEGYDIPVIFISLRYDFDARLAVSRTGAKFFFNKPVITGKLIRALDELTIHKPRDSYRILIVDDDKNIAGYHAMLLNNAGMTTQIVSSSHDILEQIPVFAPELILMDLYMPDCSGADLAHIIRQDNSYDLMPIVFLSSETDISRQMEAIKSGGDDFLTKPVNHNNLVSLVSTRVERARVLTSTTQELRSALRENQTQKIALDQHAIVSIADPEGLITYANDKFCEISKYSHNELIGKNHRLLNSGSHDKAFFQDMWEHISNGKIWHGEIKNIAKDGSYYWVDSTIMPFLNDQGNPYQYVSIRTDITHIKEAEKKLIDRKDRLQRQQTALMALANDESLISGNLEHALHTVTENVAFTLNVECVAIKLFNDDNSVLRYADLYSRSTDSHAAEPDMTRTDFQTYFDALENNRAIVAAEAISHPQLQELRESCYKEAGIASSIEAVIRRHDQLLGVVTIGSNDKRDWWPEDQNYALSIADMVALSIEQYEHYKAEEALHKIQERLSISQNFARIGTWDWDINSGDLYWSDMMKGLFDYPLDNDSNPNFDAFINMVHMDDRGALLDSITDCLEQGAEYNTEFRILHNDKSIHWVHAHGDVTRNTEGEPMHMIGVAQDITLRKKSEEATTKAKEEAEKANQAKSQFLSSMSHELRTPLNAILGFAQLFEYDEDNPLNESQVDNIQQILKSGWHLLELINEILDLSKIESGNLTISMEGVELNEILEECSNLIEPLAQKRDIIVINNIPKSERTTLIFADRTRIKQVILNLMSNAVKYNKHKGSITLSCSHPEEHRIRISVTDSGAGLNETQQSLLFQPFERLGADESDIEGTGIGLVITKRLIELMGGTIGFESTLNQGSNFWIDIDTISVSETNNINTITGEISLNKLKQDTDKKLTILYVEDNPANLKLVWQILSRSEQFEMLSAHNAELGLELAASHKPDIIILDINLPGMNGYEAFSHLRANEDTKDIPVLALSANAMASEIEKGLAAGFIEYLTKPINIKKFNVAIEKVVASL